MDLVVQNHHGAQAPCRFAGRDPHRGKQVRWALCAGKRGIAHSACHDYGSVPIYQQVQDQGSLFYGVGALGNHYTRRAGIDAAFDLRGQLDQIFQRQLRAGHLAERVGRDLGDFRDLRHVLYQRFAGQRRCDPGAALRLGRRDGAAQREHRYLRESHLASSVRGYDRASMLPAVGPSFNASEATVTEWQATHRGTIHMVEQREKGRGCPRKRYSAPSRSTSTR
jgi:hypothetical protein